MDDFTTLKTQLRATHDRSVALSILAQIANLNISHSDLVSVVHLYNQKQATIALRHHQVVFAVAPTKAGIMKALQEAISAGEIIPATPVIVPVTPTVVVAPPSTPVTTSPVSTPTTPTGPFTIQQNPVTNPVTPTTVLTGGYLNTFYANPANWNATSAHSSW